jgi:hypothetical protein
MYLTILKWVGLVALALGLVYLPFRYVDNVRVEAYAAGYSAANVECTEVRTLEAAALLREAEKMAEREGTKTAQLATDLAKQRNAAKTLKDKLDAALKNQPEATGCVLNDDVTDLLRFAAKGDFAAVEQQSDAITGPSVDEVSRGATVPGGGHKTNAEGVRPNLPRGFGSVS